MRSQTQPKQKLFEVDLKADPSAIMFRFFVCRNVNTYTQTELKQELFEVDFKADSRAFFSKR